MEPKRHEVFEQMFEDADVPVFVIDAYDPLCGLVVEQYANRAQQNGMDAKIVQNIREHAKYMQKFYNAMDRDEESNVRHPNVVLRDAPKQESDEPDMYFGNSDKEDTGE